MGWKIHPVIFERSSLCCKRASPGSGKGKAFGVKVSIGLALASQVLKQALRPLWDPQTERGEERGQLG